MNDRLPEPLRAPTPFSTPRPADRSPDKKKPPLLSPIDSPEQQRLAADKSLAQLARQSFEAGFAAGASNLMTEALPRVADPSLTDPAHSDTDPCLTALVDALTPRRLEVLKLVARGLTNPEIASVLGLSANTVKAHMTGILETLEVTNRTEAAIALQDYESEH